MSVPEPTTPLIPDGFAVMPQVWPLGYGQVATGTILLDGGVAAMLFRAVPDGMASTPGTTPTDAVWEASASGPNMAISFQTSDDVRMLADSLLKLAAKMEATRR